MTTLVAILNITPDSFSDGGMHMELESALSLMDVAFAHGVKHIDIGAESTRPGAAELGEMEEWNRLKNILNPLIQYAHEHHAKISLDTRHPNNAARALEIGVDWINDVSGGSVALQKIIRAHPHACVILMHNLGVPLDKTRTIPSDQNAAEVIRFWAKKTIHEWQKAGIDPSRIILDPGIGFGKTSEQNWELLRHPEHWKTAHPHWMVGHSRKSFLNSVTNLPAIERDIETLAISAHLANAGVEFLRVHNTELHARFFKTYGNLKAE